MSQANWTLICIALEYRTPKGFWALAFSRVSSSGFEKVKYVAKFTVISMDKTYTKENSTKVDTSVKNRI